MVIELLLVHAQVCTGSNHVVSKKEFFLWAKRILFIQWKYKTLELLFHLKKTIFFGLWFLWFWFLISTSSKKLVLKWICNSFFQKVRLWLLSLFFFYKFFCFFCVRELEKQDQYECFVDGIILKGTSPHAIALKIHLLLPDFLYFKWCN